MKIGDTVTWTSQAMGCEKTKTGKVIAEIPAKAEAKKHVPPTAKKSHIKFDNDKSVYDRVLVAVSAGKDGKITHYYCPLRSVLEAQGN
jgi:hypothetical protein